MKKIVSVFVAVIILTAVLISCNKNNPTGAATPTVVPSPSVTTDNALYGFETGTIMNWGGVSGGVTNTAVSTVNVYRGSYSLRVDGNFNAGGDNWLGVSPPSVTNMLGKKIIMRVFVPAGKPSIAGSIFVQTGGSWCWERGIWTSISAGSWKTLEFDLAFPEYSCGNNPDASDVHRLGFQFQPGLTQSYSIYIDSIEVVTAGTPTHTPTVSPTHSVSPTATPTITGTPPTATVSPTITQTPTRISTPLAPNDPNIQYYGRWNRSDALNPKCGWGANYIVAGFEGTSISININSQWDDWYAYAIDDFSDHNAFTKFRVRTGRDAGSARPTQTPHVITGLSDTTHTIMLVRRSEGISGVDTFKGFGLDTGKTLAAPAPAAPARKMEFIGDSITCGSQNEYVAAVPTATADLPCEWGGCVSNVDTAFGMQLARMYGAEGRTICRGGIGMYRNCGGCTPDYTMPQVFPYMYFETAPSGSSLTWNFASWQADVVVIALGTNDNPNASIKTQFQSAYTGFLSMLRSYYPNAYILCTEPVPSWMGTTVGTYINEVVTSYADPKVLYVPLRNPAAAGFPLLATEYANDNTHPIVSAHTKIAQALKTWIDANIMTGLVADHGW